MKHVVPPRPAVPRHVVQRLGRERALRRARKHLLGRIHDQCSEVTGDVLRDLGAVDGVMQSADAGIQVQSHRPVVRDVESGLLQHASELLGGVRVDAAGGEVAVHFLPPADDGRVRAGRAIVGADRHHGLVQLEHAAGREVLVDPAEELRPVSKGQNEQTREDEVEALGGSKGPVSFDVGLDEFAVLGRRAAARSGGRGGHDVDSKHLCGWMKFGKLVGPYAGATANVKSGGDVGGQWRHCDAAEQ
nr:hypothetical protein CFP56_03765 [Quercus suber]